MNIIDKNVFRKFLQELVFKLYAIMAFAKAITLKISRAFFSILFLLNNCKVA